MLMNSISYPSTNKTNKQSIYLRRLIISAVFLSIALTLRTLTSLYIPLFGENAMRINIGGIFSIMPSILFGPFFGGLTSGLSDFIGFQLRPSGQYLFLHTLFVAGGGAIRGGLWLFLRNKNPRIIRNIIITFATVLVLFGSTNIIMLHRDNITPYSLENYDISDNIYFMSRFIITRSQNAANPATMFRTTTVSVGIAPIVAGVFGYLLVIIDFFISKKLLQYSIMPLLLAMLTSSIIVNTLNTILFRATIFPAWQLLPFFVVWLPRVLQTIITTTIYSYFVAFLLNLCKAQKEFNSLVV